MAGVEQQEGYEHFVKTERAFLDTAADDIRALYLAAKKGDKDAGRQLTAIMVGNDADGKNERQEQADKALALLFWWSRSS